MSTATETNRRRTATASWLRYVRHFRKCRDCHFGECSQGARLRQGWASAARTADFASGHCSHKAHQRFLARSTR